MQNIYGDQMLSQIIITDIRKNSNTPGNDITGKTNATKTFSNMIKLRSHNIKTKQTLQGSL